MEHNVKRNKTYFTQKKTSPLLLIGALLLAVGAIIVIAIGSYSFIGYYFGFPAGVAGIVIILVSTNMTVKDAELEQQREELKNELDRAAIGRLSFSKSEREEERHLASGYNYTKEDAKLMRSKEGGFRSQYIYATCLLLSNTHFHVLLWESSLWDNEAPKETRFSFPVQTLRGFKLLRNTVVIDGKEVECVDCDVIDNMDKHTVVPLQNDSDIDSLAARLDKKFRRIGEAAGGNPQSAE